jgi:hypothetical protein
MPTYPIAIRRCQHIKVNGIQCGSPAKRDEMHCYYHVQCRRSRRHINLPYNPQYKQDTIHLPTLEDANSIQLGLAEVMRLVVTKQIDHPTASLLLRALRIAANNVRFTTLEPKPTQVVIDPLCVELRPLGATAWSATEGQDYDQVENDAANDKAKNKDEVKLEAKKTKTEARRDQRMKEDEIHAPEKCAAAALRREQTADLQELMDGVANDPNYLNLVYQPRASATPENRVQPPIPVDIPTTP